MAVAKSIPAMQVLTTSIINKSTIVASAINNIILSLIMKIKNVNKNKRDLTMYKKIFRLPPYIAYTWTLCIWIRHLLGRRQSISISKSFFFYLPNNKCLAIFILFVIIFNCFIYTRLYFSFFRVLPRKVS